MKQGEGYEVHLAGDRAASLKGDGVQGWAGVGQEARQERGTSTRNNIICKEPHDIR